VLYITVCSHINFYSYIYNYCHLFDCSDRDDGFFFCFIFYLHTESLAKFPRRTVNSCGVRNQAQQHEDQLKQQQHQQMMVHNSNGDQNPVQAAAMQIASSNGMVSVNSSVNSASASTTTSTIVGLLHQNSVNSRQNSMNNASSPYGGNSVQIPSPGSSSTVPQAKLIPFSVTTYTILI
jgi:hypothetical protein